MYITLKHVIVVALIYGVYRAGKTIYAEDKARLEAVETAIKELKESK